MKEALINLLLPVIVAPVTVFLGRWVLNLNGWLQNLHPTIKQAVILAISSALVAAEGFLGAQICPPEVACGLENFDQKALVAALLSFAIHNGLKSRSK